MKRETEYESFDRTMRQLLKVPHGVIKAKIEEERFAKKRKKAKQSSVSREVSGKV
jgi:hypothetical protein